MRLIELEILIHIPNEKNELYQDLGMEVEEEEVLKKGYLVVDKILGFYPSDEFTNIMLIDGTTFSSSITMEELINELMI